MFQQKRKKSMPNQNLIISVLPLPRYADFLGDRYSVKEKSSEERQNVMKEITASLLFSNEYFSEEKNSKKNFSHPNLSKNKMKTLLNTNTIEICLENGNSLKDKKFNLYPPFEIIDSEIRAGLHQNNKKDAELNLTPKISKSGATLIGGYDVFLSCSSSNELEWITQKAIPQLQ